MQNLQHLKQISYSSPLFGNIFKAYPFSSPNSTKYLMIPNAQAESKLNNPQANKFISPSLSNENNGCCYIVMEGQCLGKHMMAHRNYDDRPIFTEEEIWILIESVCSAFSILSNEGCSHKLTHFKEYSIRMLSEDRGFKLIYHEKIIPQLKCAQSNVVKWNQLYLSPEELLNEFIPEKSIVFSFGVMLLNICSNLDVNRVIYRPDSFEVDFDIVKQKIAIAGSFYGYSKLLTSFIEGCLVIEHEKRLGFVELQEFFQRKQSKINEKSSELLSEIYLIEKNGSNRISNGIKLSKNIHASSSKNLEQQNEYEALLTEKNFPKSLAQPSKWETNNRKKKTSKFETPKIKFEEKPEKINQIIGSIDYRGTFGNRNLIMNQVEPETRKSCSTVKRSNQRLSDEENEFNEEQSTNKDNTKEEKIPKMAHVNKKLVSGYSKSEFTNSKNSETEQSYETHSNPLKLEIFCHNGHHEVKEHECVNHSEEIDTPKGFGKFNFLHAEHKSHIEESTSEINQQSFAFQSESDEIPELITKIEYLDLNFCLKPVEELKNSIGKIGIWVEGDLYFGNFENGKRNGLALEIFSNGEYYYGYFKEDLFEGEGLLFWNEKEYFFGRFHLGQKLEGRLQGEVKYQGGFKNNKRHGYGTCWYSNGEIYIGGWLNGKRNGSGKVVEIDGSIFVGLWVKGRKKGDGYLENDMMKIAGYWIDEEIEGETLIEYINGDVFQGKTGPNLEKVFGEYISKSGKVFKGSFENDEPREGELIYSNKDRYIGQLRRMKRHGYGEYYYDSGEVYKGQWENNNRKE